MSAFTPGRLSGSEGIGLAVEETCAANSWLRTSIVSKALMVNSPEKYGYKFLLCAPRHLQ
jgi:hypothetical protein